jgi:CheY-like chemotaxis protein
LREQPGRESLRGIALSGFGMDEDIARSKEAGFSRHLTKPVDFAQLQLCLAAIGQQLTSEDSEGLNGEHSNR